MNYPCLYLIQRGCQRKIGKTTDPHRRILKEHGTYFPKNETDCYIFPVSCHHTRETQLKRWLSEKGYRDRSEMLKMDLSASCIDEIITYMYSLMKEDNPSADYYHCSMDQLESLSFAPVNIERRRKISKDDISEMTERYCGVSENYQQKWIMIRDFPVLDDEVYTLNIEDRIFDITNDCHHCCEKHNRKKINIIWIPEYSHDTILQIGSTCINHLFGSISPPVKHSHNPKEGEMKYLCKMLIDKGIKDTELITTLKMLDNIDIDSVLELINKGDIQKLEIYHHLYRKHLFSSFEIRPTPHDIKGIISCIESVDLPSLEQKCKLVSEKAFRMVSEYSAQIPKIVQLSDKELILLNNKSKLITDARLGYTYGYIVLDSKFSICKLDIDCSREIVILPSEATYILNSEGEYYKIDGNCIPLHDLSSKYQLSCDIEYYEEDIRKTWKSRYIDSRHDDSSKVWRWYIDFDTRTISKECEFWRYKGKTLYLFTDGNICNELIDKTQEIKYLPHRLHKRCIVYKDDSPVSELYYFHDKILLRDGEYVIENPKLREIYIDDILFGDKGYAIFYLPNDTDHKGLIQESLRPYNQHTNVHGDGHNKWFYPLPGSIKEIRKILHKFYIRLVDQSPPSGKISIPTTGNKVIEINIKDNIYIISGDTYHKRDIIKQSGGTWNNTRKHWEIPCSSCNIDQLKQKLHK